MFFKRNKVNLTETRPSFLDKIEQLTKELPDTPTLHDIASGPGYVPNGNREIESRILEVEVGEPIKEWGLFKQPIGAASVLKATAGAVAARHVHKKSVEYYVVLKGKLRSIQYFDITRGRTLTKTAEQGDVICVPKNIPHKCKFVEDTTMIVITIPEDPDMPNSPSYKGIDDD